MDNIEGLKAIANHKTIPLELFHKIVNGSVSEITKLRDENEALRKDAERLDYAASEYLTIEPFAMPTGGDDADVGWRVLQHHCGDLKPRVIAEVFDDNIRSAIDAAVLAKPSQRSTK